MDQVTMKIPGKVVFDRATAESFLLDVSWTLIKEAYILY